MNYIEQINNFWSAQDQDPLPTTDIAIYFYLLHICNSARWINPIKRNTAKIVADLGISRSTLERGRIRLKNAGFIDFRASNGSPNVTYLLLDKNNKDQKLYQFDTGNEAGRDTGIATGKDAATDTATTTGSATVNKEVNINRKVNINTTIITQETAFDFFKQTSIYRQLEERYLTSCEEKFKIFYEEKNDLNELQGKTQEDLVKWFRSWLPIHIQILNKEKSSAKKESYGSKSTSNLRPSSQPVAQGGYGKL